MRLLLILLAIAWPIALLSFLWVRDPDVFNAMAPDQWGEFLSGLFGPSGFFAVIATLLQQGSDLKRQRRNMEEQLTAMKEGVEHQTKQLETLAKQAATEEIHAHSVARQTELAIQRMEIERASNQANAMAMLAVRWADRMILQLPGASARIPLLGDKDELLRDYDAGPEAVMETVRQSLKTAFEQIKNAPSPLPPSSELSSSISLLRNLVDRARTCQATLGNLGAAEIPEINQLRSDMQLFQTWNRAQDLLNLLDPASAQSAQATRAQRPATV